MHVRIRELSDEWLNDLDLGNDDSDLFPAFDNFQRSPIDASGRSFTSKTSNAVQCSSSGMCA